MADDLSYCEPSPKTSITQLGGGKPQAFPSMIQKVVAELVGTYLLVFIGCGSLFIHQRSNLTLVGIALAWTAVVVALIYTIGHISGAHINPAITVAFASTGQFPWKQVPLYAAAQMLGSIVACFTLRWLFSKDRLDVMLSLPSSATSDLTAVLLEIIISFILMFVICATSQNTAIKELSGVAVGAAVFCNVIIAGTITGCSMNPARSIGAAIAIQKFHKIWIYIISPVIGTISGSMLDQLLRLPNKMNVNIPSADP